MKENLHRNLRPTCRSSLRGLHPLGAVECCGSGALYPGLLYSWGSCSRCFWRGRVPSCNRNAVGDVRHSRAGRMVYAIRDTAMANPTKTTSRVVAISA
jgi:hypothetical protein